MTIILNITSIKYDKTGCRLYTRLPDILNCTFCKSKDKLCRLEMHHSYSNKLIFISCKYSRQLCN
jgi:hypothetical protein